MHYNFLDLLIILLVVAGPTKAVAVYISATQHMTRKECIHTAIKSVLVASAVLFLFALRGNHIIELFHVSVPALEIAGGIILFVYAIGLVLGESHSHDEDAPTGDISIYPLAMPLMATPQAIVALVAITARVTEFSDKMMVVTALGTVMAFNLIVLVGTGIAMSRGGDKKKSSGSRGEVLLRVVALLFCAFAVELILMGLRDLQIVPTLADTHSLLGAVEE